MSLGKKPLPTLLDVQRIWNEGEHLAFPDLLYHRKVWYCSFREAAQHEGGSLGIVRIVSSTDGLTWTLHSTLTHPSLDLRDPKLSVTPSGSMMLNMGGLELDENDHYRSIVSLATFSMDGQSWSAFTTILPKHEWLWRITWHQGVAYGVAYGRSNPSYKYDEWYTRLYRSFDGLDFEMITQFDIPGYPNETTLRFDKEGTLFALVRREKPRDNDAWWGSSVEPYDSWEWLPLDKAVGGPNFLIDAEGDFVVAGRRIYRSPYGDLEKTFLGTIEADHLNMQLLLPGDGDCSYPGMVYLDGILYIAYYASAGSKSSIYLARIAY